MLKYQDTSNCWSRYRIYFSMLILLNILSMFVFASWFMCVCVVICNKTQDRESVQADRWIGKINFVEIRSFWHLFRSHDRMWSFFILCLQVILNACVFTFYHLIVTCLYSHWSSFECISTEGNDHNCLEWIWWYKCCIWNWCVQESIKHFHHSSNSETCTR